MELSPDRRKSTSKKSGISPSRMSASQNNHSMSQMSKSPGKYGQFLDLHKKTANEKRESPSKAATIVMRYINSYPDVGPVVNKPPITHQDLVEMAKDIDKKEIWTKSD